MYENKKISTICQIFCTKMSRCYYFLLEGFWLASSKSSPFIEWCGFHLECDSCDLLLVSETQVRYLNYKI